MSTVVEGSVTLAPVAHLYKNRQWIYRSIMYTQFLLFKDHKKGQKSAKRATRTEVIEKVCIIYSG